MALKASDNVGAEAYSLSYFNPTDATPIGRKVSRHKGKAALVGRNSGWLK